LILPQMTPHSDPSWFGFPILVRGDAPFTRHEIVYYLEDKKIATSMLFGGNLVKQPAYSGMNSRVVDSLKNTDLVMDNLFWIGVYPGLTVEMNNYILNNINGFIVQYSPDL